MPDPGGSRGLFEREGVQIYYEEWGQGFPVFIIAPGGMRSAIERWAKAPWNPIKHLAGQYRVIAMDQRNAGRSRAPVTGRDGWHVYTSDQLALLDHLGVDRFHYLGMCIGGTYGMGLIEAAPARVVSAVLLQPIGLDGNREAFHELFDGWAEELRSTSHVSVADEEWTSFRTNLYGGDFIFGVPRSSVASCRTPLLVFAGHDRYHPVSISRELTALAPQAELVEQWKEGDAVEMAKQRIAKFLGDHDPR